MKEGNARTVVGHCEQTCLRHGERSVVEGDQQSKNLLEMMIKDDKKYGG